MRRIPRSIAGGVALASAVALGLWFAFALAVVPWLIRSAYAEEGLPFLNALLEGRSIHPVERYLTAWRGISVKVTIGLLTLFGVAYLGVRHRTRIKAAFDDSGWSAVEGGAAHLAAVWLGWWRLHAAGRAPADPRSGRRDRGVSDLERPHLTTRCDRRHGAVAGRPRNGRRRDNVPRGVARDRGELSASTTNSVVEPGVTVTEATTPMVGVVVVLLCPVGAASHDAATTNINSAAD